MSIVHVHPIEDGKRFACYFNNECVSLSKNADYLETHYKEGDVKWLNALVIEKFVYYDINGQITKESNAGRASVQPRCANQIPFLVITAVATLSMILSSIKSLSSNS